MTDNAITTCEFLGATLWGLRGQNRQTTQVAMKAMVEGMGLDWGSQHRKLAAHPVLAPTIVIMPMVGEDGALREAVTLPLTKLPFWLATIQTGRIPDLQVRERVVAFQQRVCDVLEAAFFGEAEQVEPTPIGEKPWRLRSLEERGMDLRTALMIKQVGNHALAWWYLEKEARIANFPRQLLPAWRQQAEFDVAEPVRPRGVTITVPYSGETH